MAQLIEANIPAYLSSPPEDQPAPPIEVRKHELPIEQQTWKDFERLCFRLASSEGEIERCALYGTEGQSQEGIDIFSKRPAAVKYSVYQCKHECDFGPAKIEKAVTQFLQGSWKDRSERFVLCAKEALSSAQLTNWKKSSFSETVWLTPVSHSTYGIAKNCQAFSDHIRILSMTSSVVGGFPFFSAMKLLTACKIALKARTSARFAPSSGASTDLYFDKTILAFRISAQWFWKRLT